METVHRANGTFSAGQATQAKALPPKSRWNERQLARLYDPCRYFARQVYWGHFVLHLAVWWIAIASLSRFIRPELGDGDVFGPSPIYWFFVGLLAAAASARWPMERQLKAHFKHRVAEYQTYIAGGTSPIRRGVATLLTPLLALLAAAGIYAGSRTYTGFTEETIVISRPFEDTRIYGYREIAEIRAVAHRTAPNGEVVPLENSYYEIEFIDGALWTTAEGLRSSTPRSDHRTIAFASRKSGLLIAGPLLYRTCSGAPLSRPIAR